MKKTLILNRLLALFIVFILFSSALLVSCEIPDVDTGNLEDIGSLVEDLIPKNTTGKQQEATPPPQDTPGSVEGEMQVHFIDVGQGDCILIVSGDSTILIDSSYKKTTVTNSIISYIEALNITEIDYFILTHPHADHIGGAPQIFERFDVKNVIMPDCVNDTKIFDQTLDAIENSEANVIESVSGDEYQVGEMSFKILAPNYINRYTEINDYSIAMRLTFGATSVMLTGDIEKLSEGEILSIYSPAELDSDILKVAHHGASSSSCREFLQTVSPAYAIISVGEGNTYGHPHDVTLSSLDALSIPYYRTDRDGTVVFISDGQTFKKK